MIHCQALAMRYQSGNFTALQGLDLHIESGSICAMLGPNGAGKSTTLKILAGLQDPTSGTVRIAGKPPREARHEVGVMPENLALFDDLTVQEHLELTADLYHAPRERIAQLLRVLSLAHGSETLARQCSHGMRKKTAFAMALLPNPRVLLLDEPFEAVDPVSARAMFEILREAAHQRGVTVLLTSHILSIVERLADRQLLMRAGALVYDSQNAPTPLAPGELERLYFDIIEPPVSEPLEWLGSASS